ncbi:hypothetical protein BJV82DRAFT_598614 [Fennellomyces sp. T-0311]|nr:hypothetical protein BJV82DRAFT_598614 [Fennellomyces sp. T-0311]
MSTNPFEINYVEDDDCSSGRSSFRSQPQSTGSPQIERELQQRNRFSSAEEDLPSYAEQQRYRCKRPDESRGRTTFDSDDVSRPRNYGSNDDFYGETRFADDEGERQIEGIKQDIRNVKQDTLASTRNALQTINATQDIAGHTLEDLNEQAGQLASVDRNMGVAKAEAEEASRQARHLKRLNRSIFIPVFKNPFNRKARARNELENQQKAHTDDMAERSQARQFEHQSNARMSRAQQKLNKSADVKNRSQSDRNRYQFEPDYEDNAVEDEIDQNLDLLSNAADNLKAMANTMNDELDSQNQQLERVVDKVNPVNEHIFSTTQRLNRIK